MGTEAIAKDAQVKHGGKWMKSIDAKTLDQLITEMNEMNRWFAKVVKYWDEFSNGGDGSKVLQESGPGISQGEPGTKSGDADARELTNDDEAEEDAKNNEEDDGAGKDGAKKDGAEGEAEAEGGDDEGGAKGGDAEDEAEGGDAAKEGDGGDKAEGGDDE